MTEDDPRIRPTSAGVMERFVGIRARLTERQSRSRIKKQGESWIVSTRLNLQYYLRSWETKKYSAILSRD